jgi:hypothetical protein
LLCGKLRSKKSKLLVDKPYELGYHLIRHTSKLGERLSSKEAEMFNPVQAYYASDHTPARTDQDLNEEQFAQRYGQVIGECPLWNRIWLWVGKILIDSGEKLTAENTPINWKQETV